MASIILLLVFLLSLQDMQGVLGEIVNPQHCSPRPSLVPIDSPYFKYYPYFVELHRCGGMCTSVSPRIQKCSAASTQKISKSVFDMSTLQTKELEFFNHTRCNCSCTKSPGGCDERVETWHPDSCDCRCKITPQNPFKCPANFKWNQHVCRCLCDKAPRNCGENKEWNRDVCGCICDFVSHTKCIKENKMLDKNTCKCYNDMPPSVSARGGKGVPREIMIGCMFAELFLLLILFDIFLHCHYGDGVITSIRQRCCSKRKHGDVPLETETAKF